MLRGSPKWQVQEVFKSINALGQSKHEAKMQARETGARTWHDIGKSIGVHSINALKTYTEVAKQCLQYARENLGTSRIEQLNGNHVAEFLNSKLEQGLSKASLQNYAAALEKLEVALNQYAKKHDTGREYNFFEAIKEVREAVYQQYQDSNIQSRYIDNIREKINGIENPEHRLAAKLQAEGGARIGELGGGKVKNQLTEKNLQGIKTDPKTDKEIGCISVVGKGGKVREIHVSPTTYRQLEQHIAKHGSFSVNYHAYKNSLRSALGTEYTGTHGLRWAYAQDRFQELQASGRSYEEALQDVSSELGHNRPDITEHYLR